MKRSLRRVVVAITAITADGSVTGTFLTCLILSLLLAGHSSRIKVRRQATPSAPARRLADVHAEHGEAHARK